jgi:hypothetical protein
MFQAAVGSLCLSKRVTPRWQHRLLSLCFSRMFKSLACTFSDMAIPKRPLPVSIYKWVNGGLSAENTATARKCQSFPSALNEYFFM